MRPLPEIALQSLSITAAIHVTPDMVALQHCQNYKINHKILFCSNLCSRLEKFPTQIAPSDKWSGTMWLSHSNNYLLNFHYLMVFIFSFQESKTFWACVVRFWQNTRFCSTPPVTRGSARPAAPWKPSCSPLNTGEWVSDPGSTTGSHGTFHCLLHRCLLWMIPLMINFVQHCIQLNKQPQDVRCTTSPTCCNFQGIFHSLTLRMPFFYKWLAFARWSFSFPVPFFIKKPLRWWSGQARNGHMISLDRSAQIMNTFVTVYTI